MSRPVLAAEVKELGSPPNAAKTEGSERRSRSSCDAAYRSATYTLRGVTRESTAKGSARNDAARNDTLLARFRKFVLGATVLILRSNLARTETILWPKKRIEKLTNRIKRRRRG